MTREETENNNLKKDIYDTLKNDMMFYRAEQLTDIIISLIKKHGYEKVETLDGYWSD